MRRCLTAPVWRAEAFCEGVLLQLTEEPLDPDNPEHWERQVEAARYLGLPVPAARPHPMAAMFSVDPPFSLWVPTKPKS